MVKKSDKYKLDDLAIYKDTSFRNFAALTMPNVPVYDTSVKHMIESQTPVLPLEDQYYDNETPIHIYKDFDFKNMPLDPSALAHARNYVPPIPDPGSPQIAQPVVNQPEKVTV